MLIDFHAHILPMADHGCDSLATARRQLHLMRQAGIAAVVATPHFYPHRHTVEQFVARQNRGMQLISEMTDAPETPTVLAGAEVLVCSGLERMDGLEQLCIWQTNRVILLELPFQEITEDIWDTICEIEGKGFQPVLAHLDRYEPKVVHRALELKLPIQLNASAFRNVLQRRKWKTLVEQRQVCALGSDLHGVDAGVVRQFQNAVRILGDSADILMQRTERLLKQGVSALK